MTKTPRGLKLKSALIKRYKHTPLFLDKFLSSLDLLVELLDLLVMAVTLLVIRIQLQALAHLTGDHKTGGMQCK